MSVQLTVTSSAAPASMPSREPAPSTKPGDHAGGDGPREGCCPLCPTAAFSPSEAAVLACVLGGWGTVLGLPDITLERAEILVFTVLRDHAHHEVLRWRTRCHPSEWHTRWRAGVIATRRLYGEHFAEAAALPEELSDAERTLLPCDPPAELVPVLAPVLAAAS